MPRFDNPTLEAELKKSRVRLANLVEIRLGCSLDQYTDQATCELNSGVWLGTDYFTDFGYDIFAGGNTYKSQSDFMEFGEIKETLDLQIHEQSLTLSGLDANRVFDTLAYQLVGKEITISRCAVTLGSNTPVGNIVIPFFNGEISGATINDDIDSSSTITFGISNAFLNFDMTAGYKCNVDSHQQYEHLRSVTGDLGFEFFSTIDQSFGWGKK